MEFTETMTALEYSELYKGKLFRYHSKYGGTVENILCDGVSIKETLSVESDGNVHIVDIMVSLISDKGNVYELKQVEFYENDTKKN
jgi:hypothetical protein